MSFCDGKREGPIQGLGRNAELGQPSGVDSFVPSVRSKRIATLMDDLEGSGKFYVIHVPRSTLIGVDRI